VCKLCTKHVDTIRAAARTAKGASAQAALNYVKGVKAAHKNNMMKHVESSLHQLAVLKEQGVSSLKNIISQ
jgi:hypothetical protein